MDILTYIQIINNNAKGDNTMAKQEAISKASKYANCETWNEKGKLNAGDTIDGYFVDKEEFTTKYGDMSVYIIETADGANVKITGQTDIRSKFGNVPMGAHVWVTFEGLTETSRGAKKTYKVEFDDEDMKAF